MARELEFPEKVAKEIERDAALPAIAKRGLKVGVPTVAAEYANKAGISAEHAPKIALLVSAVLIARQGRQLRRRINKLAEEDQARKEALTRATLGGTPGEQKP